MKVKIFGAGSIGNHLAEASRRIGWDVTVVDLDSAALLRMKNEIYPKRYGSWDPAIKLFTPDEAPKGGYDVIFIGTPPHARLGVAVEALKERPRLLQLEKPIFPPFILKKDQKKIADFFVGLEAAGSAGVVGYEYVLGVGPQAVENFIRQGGIGDAEILEVSFRENWSGILNAHPWLNGPKDTYLGYWQNGGGASGEHSHAVHFWQHFSDVAGLGKIAEVSAAMEMVDDGYINYDKSCFMTVRTTKGFLGRIVQDVVTEPYQLSMRIQGNKGFAEWKKYSDQKLGTVEEINLNGKKIVNQLKRPDDFFREIEHISRLLDGSIITANSPISLDRGLQALAVVTAAHRSRLKNSSFEKVLIPNAA